MDIKDLLKPSNKLAINLKNKADRIIMNLPESSLNFLDVTTFLLKETGGLLHIYQFCEKDNPIEKAIQNLKLSLKKLYWNVDKVLFSKIVKAFSPKLDLVVIDAFIKQTIN